MTAGLLNAAFVRYLCGIGCESGCGVTAINSIAETGIAYFTHNSSCYAIWHINYASYPNSIKSEETYINGEQHGKDIEWHENGKVSRVSFFIKGYYEGPYITWFYHGEKRSQGGYIHSRFHGKQYQWNLSGKLIREHLYDNGNLTKVIHNLILSIFPYKLRYAIGTIKD